MQFSFGDTLIRVTHATRAAVLAEAAARLTAGRGFALATINLDHVVKLHADPGFRPAYAEQDLVVADGNPIVWLSWLAARPVSLVPGSDLVVPLVWAAARADRPVALVGSTAKALDAAWANLSRQVPGLRAGPRIAPPMGFDPAGDEARTIMTRIAQEGPCLVLLALGAPRQERLAALGRHMAPEAGFASVGAGLDFIAGTQTRAPAWVRRMALEWMWRMLTSPGRMMPRYAACAAILPAQAMEALRLRAR